MKKRYPTSIDGFVSSCRLANRSRSLKSDSQSIANPNSRDETSKPEFKTSSVRLNGDLYQAIEPLDLEPIDSSLLKKPQRKRGKLIAKIISLFIFLIVLGLGGYLLSRVLKTSNSVLLGDWTGLFQSEPLKSDSSGRTNLLVFGTAEDDEDGTHSGGNLTDSIMIISYSQSKKDLAMISLPRDLWIKLPQICSVGNQEKLNTIYFCGSSDGLNEDKGAQQLSAKVSEITGLEIQYYAHLNFGAVVELIDAVGGIDVKIESDDPRGILDRNFDWKCDYKCYYVKYKNGEVAHMDGEHALAFMRARNASGGYGLPNANFDREKNQQRAIKALISKLTEQGTLTNFSKLANIIDTVGKNLRTNVLTKEVRSFVNLAKDINLGQIRSIPLVGDDLSLVKTGSMLGRSVVLPVLGIFDYSGIDSYLAKQLAEPELAIESAKVGIYNDSSTPKAARNLANELESKGFIISEVGNVSATSKSDSNVIIYAMNNAKPISVSKIVKITGGQLIMEDPTFSFNKSLDILVIIKVAPEA